MGKLFEKLRKEMSFEEVQAIIGKPHFAKDDFILSLDYKTNLWYYQNSRGVLEIEFRDGKFWDLGVMSTDFARID